MGRGVDECVRREYENLKISKKKIRYRWVGGVEEDCSGGGSREGVFGCGRERFSQLAWSAGERAGARALGAKHATPGDRGGAGGRYPKHARLGGGSSAENAIAHARSKTRRHTPAPPGPSAENKNVPRTGVHPKTNSPFERRRRIKFRKNASGFRDANRYAKQRISL